MRLGLVTIGQSPRRDILEDLEPLLRGIRIVERGALDEFARKDLEKLVSEHDEEVYVTRLRDGTEIRVSKRRIEELLQQAIDSIEELVDVVVVLCTGDLGVRSRKPLILPGKVLTKVVEALSPRSLTVFVPLDNQISMALKRWSTIVPEVRVYSWSPYSGSLTDLEKMARGIDTELVVMDCIGYSKLHASIVSRACGKPVLLPRVLSIAVALSMIHEVRFLGRGRSA